MLSAVEYSMEFGQVRASSDAKSRLQKLADLAETMVSLACSRISHSCHFCSGVSFSDSCTPSFSEPQSMMARLRQSLPEGHMQELQSNEICSGRV